MVEYAKIRLWADRVRLVREYLAHSSKWPDGIDTKYERWYQSREDYWAGLARNLDDGGAWAGGLDDEAAYKRFGLLAAPVRAAAEVAADGPVSAAERMRRYRARKRSEPV